MEGIYYQDSQEDNYFEFNSSDDMIVADSYVPGDSRMVLSEDEKSLSAEIIEDTYEKDENAILVEDVNGQEESSKMTVGNGESNRLKEVTKAKPPLDFDLNELPMLDISPPLSPIVEEARCFDLNQLPPVDDEEGRQNTAMLRILVLILILRILVTCFH